MILFLDTISPSPSFSIIDGNKIYYSIQIIKKKGNKISDSIIPTFLEIQKIIDIKKDISKLVVCTGPGSYTSLRIGVAFMYGLYESTQTPLIGVQCLDLLKLNIQKKNLNTTLIFISSMNDQYFLSLPKNYKDIIKIDPLNESNLLNKNIYNRYNSVISNYKIPKKILNSKKFEFNKIISFSEIIEKHYKKILLLSNNYFIKPIYISENKILSQ